MIYKLVDDETWHAALQAGSFGGAGIDLTDGFIHFSTGEQLPGTAEKYFAGRTDLIIVAVDPEVLGTTLRYEPSRDGALFPHLYGELSMDNVAYHRPFRCAHCDVVPPADHPGSCPRCAAE